LEFLKELRGESWQSTNGWKNNGGRPKEGGPSTTFPLANLGNTEKTAAIKKRELSATSTSPRAKVSKKPV